MFSQSVELIPASSVNYASFVNQGFSKGFCEEVQLSCTVTSLDKSKVCATQLSKHLADVHGCFVMAVQLIVQVFATNKSAYYALCRWCISKSIFLPSFPGFSQASITDDIIVTLVCVTSYSFS